MSILDPKLYRPSTDVCDELICPICKNILMDPIYLNSCELSHKHLFCRSCILKWLETDLSVQTSMDDIDFFPVSEGKVALCPMCRIHFNKNSICTDVQTQNRVNDLEILCPNLCGELLYIRNLTLHLESCPLQSINCTNIGCTLTILRKNLDFHLKNCLFSKLFCKYNCGRQFYRTDLCTHYLKKECFIESEICRNCNLKIVSLNHNCINELREQNHLFEAQNKILLDNFLILLASNTNTN